MVKVKRTTEGKLCTKCGKFKSWSEFPINKWKFDGYFYRCRACLTTQKQKYYQNNKEKWQIYDKLSQTRHPEKWKARALVREAVKSGKLTKHSCQKCSNPKVHAHHPDYSKPLKVMWLCQKHHMELHRKYGSP